MSRFSIRDLCWLVLVICAALGFYQEGKHREQERVQADVRATGLYEDRKSVAVAFPLKDKNGVKDGRMIRFWQKPHGHSSPKATVYRIDFVYPNGLHTSSYLYISSVAPTE